MLPATVNFAVKTSAWLTDQFRFGVVGDTSWSFTNKYFLCDFKQDPSQSTPDLSLSSQPVAGVNIDITNGIIVVDVVQRILKFNVTDKQLQDYMQLGPESYDLIMVDQTTGERDPLMTGVLTVDQGVTLTGNT